MNKFLIFQIQIILTLFKINLLQKIKFKYLESNIPHLISEYYNVILPNYNFIDTIDYIKEIFSQYAFIDILKYHQNKNFNKTDIMKKLEDYKKEINNQTKFYDFYRNIIKIIGTAHDQHIDISFTGIDGAQKLNELKDVFIMLPIKIEIDENKKTKIVPNTVIEYYQFENYFPSYEKIKNNSEKIVDKINGKDPFDFIRDFGKEFLTFKNKNAKFTYTKILLPIFRLKYIPMSPEEFNNFTITYKEGNEEITVNYVAFLIETNNNVSNENKIETTVKNIKFYREISKKKLKEEDEIKWNYSNIEGSLKCKVDHNKEANIYYQNSFYIEDNNINDLIKILKSCYDLFQENDYPIFVIEDTNGGGYLFYSEIFTRIVQNIYNQKNYFSIMITNSTKKLNENEFVGFNNELGYYYDNYEQYLKYNKINETFLGEINIERTIQRELDVLNTEDIKRLIINYSKKLRKPTDIVVFTDGFSFSATSLFIKSLQNFGGAIIVGYNGDPESEAIDFDASQSPTFIQGQDFLKNINNYDKLVKNGFTVGQISYGPSYKNSYNYNIKSIPQEFEEFPVDERMKFYNSFEETLDIYNKFVQKGLDIVDKYITNCNKYNKNLKLLNETCNVNAYTYGGFVCDDKGNWSSECQPFYCDAGYYFDNYTKSCLLDPINITYENIINLTIYQINEIILNDQIDYFKDKKNLYKYLFIIISLILIIIIVILVIKIYKLKKKRDKQIKNLSLIYTESIKI